MNKIFDISKFKKYINTYVISKNFNLNIILDDIIYGIGISLDETKYNYYNGYRSFKNLLIKKFLNEDTYIVKSNVNIENELTKDELYFIEKSQINKYIISKNDKGDNNVEYDQTLFTKVNIKS